MEKPIQELLKKTISRNSDDLLECEIIKLCNLYGDIVYVEALRQLTGKTISACKSRRYWHEALALRDGIEKGTQYRLSIRAALLDFLLNRSSEFKNLVFIEAKHLDSIRHCSVTDGLTGLYNQTYFKTLLGQNIPLRRRIDDSASALILMDLDHFKLYNDCCGHVAGDEALRTVANIIRDQIREQDVAARYGGDEFAVYLPKVTKSVAFAVADRIRQAIETTAFRGQELLSGKRLTTSCGISFFSEQTNDVNLLIDLADKELYNAKRRRNSISPSNYERRRHQRHATQALLECYLTDLTITETAMVSNFSSTGIGIWGNLSVAPQERLKLRFRKPFWSDDLEIDGFVRQIYPDKDTNLHYLGIEFERSLDDCTNFICSPLVKSSMTH
ncbi:MAG: GGDEF domain-containing protein [Steroidobacteraceae bacterium]|nr:GGDEF domain-containing protein [Deltaproteobacteria bacterium]